MSLIDSPADVAVGGRRAEVLAVLRDAGSALSVAQVAERSGLHVNTARFQLVGLVLDGLVERAVEGRDTPGRPRILFSAKTEVSGPRSFGLLAEMLTGVIGSLGVAGPSAVEAGQAWGRRLVESAPSAQLVSAEEAADRLNQILDAIGFQPEAHATADGIQVQLHNCPFREVAQRHPDVVCDIHLGLMTGALDELQASLAVESLEPFVTPTKCVAQLREVSRKPMRRTSP